MIASSVCHQVGIYVGIQELRRFVDGFLVGVSLDLGERLDGELGRNIVDYTPERIINLNSSEDMV